jgi:hypothetical protein
MRNTSSLIKSFLQLCFLIVFLVVLILPVTQQIFHPFRLSELFENRNRTEFPSGNIVKKLITNPIAAQEYEKYFNDNYGFRDYLITKMNAIDYHAFNSSDNVVIGNNEWLEYRSVMEKDQINAERLTADQLKEIEARFLDLNSQLKAKGMTLVVVPVPNKNTIYPEHFTNVNFSRPAVTAFMKLNNFFKSHNEIVSIDATTILTDAKEKYRVFPKNDFHWTEVGQFLIVEATVNKLGDISGTGIKMNQPLELDITKDGFRGGLNIALGIQPESRDDWVLVKKPWLEQANRAKIAGEPKLPLSLLVGNSFTGGFKELGFDDHFVQLNWLHSNVMNFLNQHLRDWPQTRYVIFQYLETEVGYKFGDPAWWPEELPSQ